MRFNIGDRVLCVDTNNYVNSCSNNPPLVKGREYIVYGIKYCISCGVQVLDVGLLTDRTGASICICGAENPKLGNLNIHWASGVRFVKREEQTEAALMEQVNEILKKEKV